MLDGPLAKKIPDATVARELVMRDVMTAMRALLVASSAALPPRGKKKLARSR